MSMYVWCVGADMCVHIRKSGLFLWALGLEFRCCMARVSLKYPWTCVLACDTGPLVPGMEKATGAVANPASGCSVHPSAQVLRTPSSAWTSWPSYQGVVFREAQSFEDLCL